MTIKTLLTAATMMVMTATTSFAMGCKYGDHETASMSCAEGTVFDAATNSCKTVSG